MGEVMGHPTQDKELLASGSGWKINILEKGLIVPTVTRGLCNVKHAIPNMAILFATPGEVGHDYQQIFIRAIYVSKESKCSKVSLHGAQAGTDTEGLAFYYTDTVK